MINYSNVFPEKNIVKFLCLQFNKFQLLMFSHHLISLCNKKFICMNKIKKKCKEYKKWHQSSNENEHKKIRWEKHKFSKWILYKKRFHLHNFLFEMNFIFNSCHGFWNFMVIDYMLIQWQSYGCCFSWCWGCHENYFN